MARGFFGPTPEFDEFLDTYMKPVMLDAGFKASGRKYVLRGAGGSAVVAHPDLYTPSPPSSYMSFHLDWAAIPSVLRDYIVGRHPSWRPSLRWGLIVTRLKVPIDMRERHYASTLWEFAPPDASAYGELFRRVLVDQAIPKWKRALTTEYLATAYETDPDLAYGGGDGAMRGGRYWAKAILGADEGDPEEATRAIDFMAERNEGDPIIPWLRNRLAARTAKSSSR